MARGGGRTRIHAPSSGQTLLQQYRKKNQVHHLCSQPWYVMIANYEDRQTSRSIIKTEKGGPKFYIENHLLPIWK